MHWNIFKFHCYSDVQEKYFKDCITAQKEFYISGVMHLYYDSENVEI